MCMQISCEFARDFVEKRRHYYTTIAPQKSCEKPANRRAASDEKPTPDQPDHLIEQRFPTGGEFPPRGEFSISQGGNSSLPRFKKNMLKLMICRGSYRTN